MLMPLSSLHTLDPNQMNFTFNRSDTLIIGLSTLKNPQLDTKIIKIHQLVRDMSLDLFDGDHFEKGLKKQVPGPEKFGP